jgi:hypothetical protein
MSFSLNGSSPDAGQRGFRWIWFGGSIISDWNNPIATSNRAVIRALQQRGHQVTFIEPADSPAFMDALRARGSAIYRAFQEVYPDIHYRRETLPGGSEGDVWLSRETALADVLIVQNDAPAHIFDWLVRLPDTPIVRLLIAQPDPASVSAKVFDAVLFADAAGYEPGVLAANQTDWTDRSGTLTVVYGGAAPEAGGGEIVAAGFGASASLPFVPEVRLPVRYRAVERVIIQDNDSSPFAKARAMLAVASGAEVAVMRGGEAPQAFDAWNDADQQAARLIDRVTALRTTRSRVQE